MNNQEVTELKDPYFEIQAKMGITKHMGGLKATKELARLCHINADKYVLVVGCGSGVSACKMSKMYGCKVVGIDISQEMVDLSSQRAQKEGLTDRVDFRIADVQDLPFGDNVFDAVISESVTSFPDNKQKAISEYARVVKNGGYIGLNEVTWMEVPTLEMKEYAVYTIGGCKPEIAGKWKKLLQDGGLQDVTARSYKIKKLDQFVNEFKMSGLVSSLKGGYILLTLYLTKPAYRKAMNDMAKDALSMPKHFMKYYGYGIYVGRK